MVQPAHNRVTVKGTFGSPAAKLEDWQFSLNFLPGAFANAQARVDAANAIRAAWVQHARNTLSDEHFLTGVRVAEMVPGPNGTAVVATDAQGAYKQGDMTDQAVSGDVPAPYYRQPLQSAVVVSLVTARGGPTGKGRFFAPYIPTGLGADFRYPQATLGYQIDYWAAFLTACNGIMPGDLCVSSSKGYNSVVTGIRMGRTPDTQRSRRTDLPESYVSASI